MKRYNINMKSKTIIISNIERNNQNGRGILTLYQEDDLLKCKLRLYNVKKLNRYCKLGIYHNNEVFSANLIDRNGFYESSMVGNFDMDTDFYAAIIDTSENNAVILAGGTYAGYYFDDNSVFDNLQNNDDNTINSTLNIDDKIAEDKCANCEYKKCFYESSNELKSINIENNLNEDKKIETTVSNTDKNENSEAAKDTNTAPTILESIIPQFNYIFENYPADTDLNSLISNSKFVKLNEGNEQYSIGAIYEDEQIKYICYAVKCNYNSPAPEELGNNYQWLPLDREDPLSEGYYIVYQDAVDLKIVEIER